MIFCAVIFFAILGIIIAFGYFLAIKTPDKEASGMPMLFLSGVCQGCATRLEQAQEVPLAVDAFRNVRGECPTCGDVEYRLISATAHVHQYEMYPVGSPATHASVIGGGVSGRRLPPWFTGLCVLTVLLIGCSLAWFVAELARLNPLPP